MGTGKRARLFIRLLAIGLRATTSLVTVAVWNNRTARATIGMGWGLILLWIGAGGGLMYLLREKTGALIARVPLGWRWKFILFSTRLALLEAAITTTMTNLAPVFGVRPGEAFITASANYLDVVTMHSVVVFIPMFVGWQWMLGRWQFTPFQVFLLFGITGTLAEGSFGVQHLPLDWGGRMNCDMEAGGVSGRLRHGGPQGAKPRAEVIADILASSKERRA